MKRSSNAGKAYSDGFAAGLAKGRDEREAEVAKLKQALDKALAENLVNRPKPTHLDAVARQGSHGAIAR